MIDNQYPNPPKREPRCEQCRCLIEEGERFCKECYEAKQRPS